MSTLNLPVDCCSGQRCFSVFSCFERGLITRRRPPLAVQGESIALGSLWAAFSMSLGQHGRMVLRFQSAHCTTLIACCQALAELYCGAPRQALQALSRDELLRSLLAQLRDLPASRHDRALLAVCAFKSALYTSDYQSQGEVAS